MADKNKNRVSILKTIKNKLSRKKKAPKVTTTKEAGVTKKTIGNEKLQAESTMCYVVNKDELVIGTRGELQSKLNKKIGILELDTETHAKIEAKVKLINETFTKSAETGVKGEVKNKSTAKLGKHIEASVESEAKVEATAKAMIDLTQLLVELGVDVKASVKIEGAVSIDLKVVDIKAYINGQLSAEASAKASLSWKGVAAEAKASAEASATMGAEIKTKPFKIGKNDIQLALRPSITAFARAEAKAAAAAGIKTGVSVGASAAIGLRGTIEAALLGDYTIKKGLDDMNRTVKKGKSVAKPTVVKGKDLGAGGVEVELALSVGAKFEVNPFEFKKEMKDGLEYGVGLANFSVDIPGIISGPAGVGVGIKVYLKVLWEIADDIKEKLKKEIKHFIVNVVGKILKEKFEKFMKEAKALAEKTKDFGLDITISILDFIGKDLNAIDLEIKRRDKKLIKLNKIYMEDKTSENKKILSEEFERYNTYVEKAFGAQSEKIVKLLNSCADKVDAIRKKSGKQTTKETNALATAKKKTLSTTLRMKELINTKVMTESYLKASAKAGSLAVDPSIIEHIGKNIASMKETQELLENFANSVS